LQRFKEYDEQQIALSAPHRHDIKKLVALTEQGRRDIAELLAEEADQRRRLTRTMSEVERTEILHHGGDFGVTSSHGAQGQSEPIRKPILRLPPRKRPAPGASSSGRRLLLAAGGEEYGPFSDAWRKPSRHAVGRRRRVRAPDTLQEAESELASQSGSIR